MSRAAVIFGERIITQSSEYGVHSAGTGTSGNGWIGIGTATGAQAPRLSAIPIGVAREGPSPSGHGLNHAIAESLPRPALHRVGRRDLRRDHLSTGILLVTDL